MAKTPAKRASNGQTPKRTAASRKGVRQQPIGEHFKLVFVTTSLLTAGFFAGAVYLGMTGHKEMSDKCFMLVTAGFGAIIGLIGGKTL
jgi:hypothetical protein